MISLKELKFKEKDELVEIFKSWTSKIPFKMQELRDQRLRYHYKDRYDFRTNLIDWDYTMNLKDYVKYANPFLIFIFIYLGHYYKFRTI